MHSVQFNSVQSLSRVPLFATPWTAARQASLSITNSQSLLKLMSIELVMPSNSSWWSHPLLSPSPPAFNLSLHCVSSLHQVAKVLELLLQHQSFLWIFKPVFEYSSIYSIEYIQYYLNIATQTCTEMPGWGRLTIFWVSSRSWWCQPTISFFVVPFSSYCQS